MKKDVGWKEYFQDNCRYADLINGLGCGGKQYVKPEDLHEADTEAKGKARDLLRKTAFGMNFAIIGIENQEEVDYEFPLRNLHYEVNQYERQAARIRREVKENAKGLSAGEYLYRFRKENKLYPVLTFVLYTGVEPWDGPMSLADILDFTDIPKELKNMTANYSINLIDIRRLEDTSVFQTDLKHVFDFIRCAEDKKKLVELVNNEPYYRNMDEEALEVVSLYAKSKELVTMKKYKNEGGKWDVCKGIKDLMADSKAEGREEGREEGIRALVNTCKSLDVALEFVEEKLQEQFHISRELAVEKIRLYW